MRFIILPGNGCVNIRRSNWYGYLADELSNRGVEVACENMPDPHAATESEWIPFIHNTLKVDTQTVVVSHSSGACCALRLLEKTPVYGVILVSAAHTDLGDENEAASGYFNRPWDWEKIRSNAGVFLHQFHSADDHLIPVREARHIAKSLHLTAVGEEGGETQFLYEELNGRNHFFDPFAELLRVVDQKLKEEKDKGKDKDTEKEE